MNPKRGDIYWANIRQLTGLYKTRLVLIVQNDIGNTHGTQTIVAAIRHETQKNLPIYVSVNRGMGGLKKDSVIDCGIVTTVYKNQLKEHVGHLPAYQMEQVNNALKISLQLS